VEEPEDQIVQELKGLVKKQIGSLAVPDMLLVRGLSLEWWGNNSHLGRGMEVGGG
jgi:hypothetical protein